MLQHSGKQGTPISFTTISNQMTIAHLGASLVAAAAAVIPKQPDKIRRYRTFAQLPKTGRSLLVSAEKLTCQRAKTKPTQMLCLKITFSALIHIKVHFLLSIRRLCSQKSMFV